MHLPFNDGSDFLLPLRRGCYSEIHRKSQSSGKSAFCSRLCLVTANTNLQLIKNKIFCYINDDECNNELNFRMRARYNRTETIKEKRSMSDGSRYELALFSSGWPLPG